MKTWLGKIMQAMTYRPDEKNEIEEIIDSVTILIGKPYRRIFNSAISSRYIILTGSTIKDFTVAVYKQRVVLQGISNDDDANIVYHLPIVSNKPLLSYLVIDGYYVKDIDETINFLLNEFKSLLNTYNVCVGKYRLSSSLEYSTRRLITEMVSLTTILEEI